MTTNIGSRLAHIRGVRSQAAFAKDFGVSKNSIGNWERGDRVPDAAFLGRLVDAGYNANWLLTGVSPMMIEGMHFGSRVAEQSPAYGLKKNTFEPTAGNDYAYIPLFDVRAAAGHGTLVEQEQVIDSLAFKHDWLRNELHLNPTDLYLIHVDGESMEPTLRPGDVILVNHTDNGPSRDGIYVLRMDDALLVKRLQRLPGGTIKVSSDNTAYDSFNLNSDARNDGLSIIGRVVWSGRRM